MSYHYQHGFKQPRNIRFLILVVLIAIVYVVVSYALLKIASKPIHITGLQ